MAIVAIRTFMICSLVTLADADLHGQRFLRKSPKVHASTDAIRNELTGVLSEILGHGHGVTEDRMKLINATLLPIFRTLPKNNRGHISKPMMRYALRRYFSATRAWVMHGFEEHGDYAFNASNSDTDILQRNMPDFVGSALEQKFAHQGFSLHDMLSMIAVLESLTFNEVVRSVEFSYHLNSFASDAILSEAELENVLVAYLMRELTEGASGAIIDVETIEDFKASPYEIFPEWDTYKAFLKDISGSDGFGRHTISNPFTVKTFTFEDVVRMAGTMTEEYGHWDDHACEEMKGRLSAMDVHETGRIKISDFYKIGDNFREPSEYLKQLGALDESSDYLGAQLVIPNYISGMSNCITNTLHFSICCPNKCHSIYQHIESEIPRPNGTVSQILEAVESFRTFPVISQHMMNKLEEIAAINDGSIPLHGRLFAQWLHFAIPRDCPYPHAVGSISPTAPARDKLVSQPASHDEKMQHIKHVTASYDPSPDAGTDMWTLQEGIVDFSTPSDTEDAKRHAMFSSQMLRVSSQFVIMGLFAALLLREGMKMLGTFKGDAKPKEYTV